MNEEQQLRFMLETMSNCIKAIDQAGLPFDAVNNTYIEQAESWILQNVGQAYWMACANISLEYPYMGGLYTCFSMRSAENGVY